jgi:hypothetical protein
MGEDYYPTPWSLLKYDTNLGGYRTNLTEDQLEKAPKYSQSTRRQCRISLNRRAAQRDGQKTAGDHHR